MTLLILSKMYPPSRGLAIIFSGFRPQKVPENLDAIVIGSGIGGLSTAVMLGRAGQKVLVLEQHDQAGGACHTFIDKGYEFDTGRQSNVLPNPTYSCQASRLKFVSYSTQLSMKFTLFITVKISTIVGILTFISRISTTSENKKKKNLHFQDLSFMSS